MDCVEAQRLVSDAMDRQPVDATLLAQAKEHCRSCTTCSVFVRTQLTLRQSPLPSVPEGLTERVLSAVRAEAQAIAEAAQADESTESECDAQPKAEDVRPEEPAFVLPIPAPLKKAATLAPPKRRNKLDLPRPVVVGGLAVAMLAAVVMVGVGVVVGVRLMSSPVKMVGMLTSSARSEAEAPTVDYNPNQKNAAKDQQSGAASGPDLGAAAPSAAQASPEFITVNGVVYYSGGPSDADISTMKPLGTALTALGGKNPPKSRSVYVGFSPDSAYLKDDDGRVIAFTRMTRQYLSHTYVLMSANISAFGEYPSLPEQMTAPTASTGAPTFTFEANDSDGIPIYRLSNSTSAQGIALAPNPPDSSLAGDSNWTWWAALR
jgi:hypothetical protein